MKKLIALACTLLLLCACSGVSVKSGSDVRSDEIQFREPDSGDTVASIETNKGTIKVLLFPKIAPKACENFIQLSQNGYYDGLSFYRVIEDFIIQSGSPDNTSYSGMSVWGLEFTDEFSDLLHNYTGALAMANHGPDTNGSQFYFVTTPSGKISDELVRLMKDAGWRDGVIETYKSAGGDPTLDYNFTVFGQIYDGLDVAYKISRVKTDSDNRPVKDVTIKSVTISVVE